MDIAALRKAEQALRETKELRERVEKLESLVQRLDSENSRRRPLNSTPPRENISIGLGQQIADIEAGKVTQR